jgi:endonuclease-3
VAVILSAQSTDKQVNKVTWKLFQSIFYPEDILLLWEDKLKKEIKSIGLNKIKAHNIVTMSWQLLSKTYRWVIPKEVNELMKLAGVGLKTAKVVAHQLYGALEIAVDTHIHRVCNRLWRVHTKTPEQTSKALEILIYKKNIYLAHHSLILFGRYQCKAKKPLCEQCPLQKNCSYFNK